MAMPPILLTVGFLWLQPRYDAFLTLLDRATAERSYLERTVVRNTLWGFEGLGIAGAFFGHYAVLSVFWVGCATLIVVGAAVRRSLLALLFGIAFAAAMLAMNRSRLTDGQWAVVKGLREAVSRQGDREVGLRAASDALDGLVAQRLSGGDRTSGAE